MISILPFDKPRFVFLAALTSFLLLSSCSSSKDVGPTASLPTRTQGLTITLLPSSTTTPTSVSTSTATPAPTNTFTPTATITPTGTPDRTATSAVRSTQAAETAVARIKEDLQPYNLSIDEGQLGWYATESSNLKLTGWNGYDHVFVGENLVFSNFIFKVDVTWHSQTGLAICGLLFRAESDIKNGDYYTFNTLRLSGLPAWDIEYWKRGIFNHIVTGTVRYNDLIDQDQGAKNQYVIHADKTVITSYANQGRLGIVETIQRADGRLGFYAEQESGETNCLFENAWVWELP